MSESPDPTQEAVDAAHRNMMEQKAAGEWDGRRGDIPARLGPHLVPDGWHTLAEAAAVLSEATESSWDGMPTNAMHRLRWALQGGLLQVHALDGAGRVVRVPADLWFHLLGDDGGWQNLEHTVARSCLTGGAFEPSFVGLTPVITVPAFRALVLGCRGDVRPASQPWLRFPSVSAWLADPSAMLFAAARLQQRNPHGGRHTDLHHRHELVRALEEGGYRTPRGGPITLASLTAIIRKAQR